MRPVPRGNRRGAATARWSHRAVAGSDMTTLDVAPDSEDPYALGLRALLSLGGLELHPLAFVQLSESVALDAAEMDEDVLPAIVRRDEAVALVTVKPLHGALRHETNSPRPCGEPHESLVRARTSRARSRHRVVARPAPAGLHPLSWNSARARGSGEDYDGDCALTVACGGSTQGATDHELARVGRQQTLGSGAQVVRLCLGLPLRGHPRVVDLHLSPRPILRPAEDVGDQS